MLADAMAAIIGKNFGKIQLVGKKTLEGTTTYFLVVVVWFTMFDEFSLSWTILIGVVCALSELLSGKLDNIMSIIILKILIEIMWGIR